MRLIARCRRVRRADSASRSASAATGRRPGASRRCCSTPGLRSLSVAPAALGRGQGGDRRHPPRSRRWRDDDDRRRATPIAAGVADYKAILQRVLEIAAVRHAAAPRRRRSARTAASSRRSPTRPTPRRSRRGTSIPSSRSATSRRPSARPSSPPTGARIRAATSPRAAQPAPAPAHDLSARSRRRRRRTASSTRWSRDFIQRLTDLIVQDRPGKTGREERP